MEVFAAVAEAGSFAAAARRLGLSPPAVTRAVAALESAARRAAAQPHHPQRQPDRGRARRSSSSTRRLLADLDEAERAAAGATAIPSGHLRLTAPLTFGRMHLMPVLAAFLREQPRVTATLVTLDRVANLIEEGFDVAVRIAQLPDSTHRRPPDRRGAARCWWRARPISPSAGRRAGPPTSGRTS